ncbi:MAG: hypothetical protein H6739_12455 [Alphaproteobacteria bacterium]|nr:hypothetical protein [Alphaproteobacteria bacterium]
MLRTLILAATVVLPSCWNTGECTIVAQSEERTCETNDDCAVAWADCAQHCSCVAVNVAEVDAIESLEPVDCGTRLCDEEACTEDCKDTKVAVCVRNRCELYDADTDSAAW